MKTKVFGLIVMFMFGVMTVFAGDKTEKFVVKGGKDCKSHIEQAAKTVDGVTEANWDEQSQQLEVKFDDSKTDADKIEVAIAQAGHDTPNHMAKDEDYDKLPDGCKSREKGTQMQQNKGTEMKQNNPKKEGASEEGKSEW